jgi:hypothetical protein
MKPLTFIIVTTSILIGCTGVAILEMGEPLAPTSARITIDTIIDQQRQRLSPPEFEKWVSVNIPTEKYLEIIDKVEEATDAHWLEDFNTKMQLHLNGHIRHPMFKHKEADPIIIWEQWEKDHPRSFKRFNKQLEDSFLQYRKGWMRKEGIGYT